MATRKTLLWIAAAPVALALLSPFMSFTKEQKKMAFHGCDLTTHIEYLEHYGKVDVMYFTSSYSARPYTWKVEFNSHPSTGYEFQVKERHVDVCEAMNRVMAKVHDFPMTMKSLKPYE